MQVQHGAPTHCVAPVANNPAASQHSILHLSRHPHPPGAQPHKARPSSLPEDGGQADQPDARAERTSGPAAARGLLQPGGPTAGAWLRRPLGRGRPWAAAARRRARGRYSCSQCVSTPWPVVTSSSRMTSTASIAARADAGGFSVGSGWPAEQERKETQRRRHNARASVMTHTSAHASLLPSTAEQDAAGHMHPAPSPLIRRDDHIRMSTYAPARVPGAACMRTARGSSHAESTDTNSVGFRSQSRERRGGGGGGPRGGARPPAGRPARPPPRAGGAPPPPPPAGARAHRCGHSRSPRS